MAIAIAWLESDPLRGNPSRDHPTKYKRRLRFQRLLRLIKPVTHRLTVAARVKRP